MIKAVLFDLDDTLYTSFGALNERSYDAVADWAGQNLGIPAAAFREQAVAWRKHYHTALHAEPESHDRILPMQSALEYFGVNPILYAQQLHNLYWDTLIAGMELRPGTPELLDELRGMGIQTCVCTNMMIDRQMEKIRKLGLAERFDAFVASEEAGRDKPSPRIFELCLKNAAVPPRKPLWLAITRSMILAARLRPGFGTVFGSIGRVSRMRGTIARTMRRQICTASGNVFLKF